MTLLRASGMHGQTERIRAKPARTRTARNRCVVRLLQRGGVQRAHTFRAPAAQRECSFADLFTERPLQQIATMNLDAVLRELEEDEPKVMVAPEIGAFCLVRGTPPPVQPRAPGRLPLELILAYIANPF